MTNTFSFPEGSKNSKQNSWSLYQFLYINVYNQNTGASSYFIELCICIGITISRKYTSKEKTNQKYTPICKKKPL